MLTRLPISFFVIFSGAAFFLKLVIFVFFRNAAFFGGGNDADYYEDYALGEGDLAVNFWPIFLRFLEMHGLFDRGWISFLLFIFASFLIPYLLGKIISYGLTGRVGRKYFWWGFFVASLYPTLLFLSFDIYRDLVMVVIFLLYLRSAQILCSRFSLFYILVLSLSIFLAFLMRKYLGVSMLFALLAGLGLRYQKNLTITKVFLFFLLILVVLNAIGLLQPLHEYRGEDGFEQGGSSLGINLNKGPVLFFFYYIYSFLMQVFGLFLVSPSAIFVFIFESVFFIWMFLKIRATKVFFISSFGLIALAFLCIYTSVFVVANDNLGTAVRLRIYTYFSVFILCYGCIFFDKNEGRHDKGRK